MKPIHVFKTLPLAAACMLVSITAHARIVSYTATGLIEQVDNGSNLLPGALTGALVGESLSFHFSIDTSTPGTASTGDQAYFSAVRSAGYTLGDDSGSIGFADNAVEILNDAGGVSGFVLGAGDPLTTGYSGTAAAVSLVTLAYSSAPLHLYRDTSLGNAPLSARRATLEDDLTLSFTSYLNDAVQTVSDVIVGPLSVKQTINPMQAPEIDPSSATAGLTLLIGGTLVFVGRQRRLPAKI